MFNKITAAEVKNAGLLSDNAIAWAIENIDYLNKPIKLFGSSVKVEKGADKFNTAVMYMQPANKVSKITLCASAKMAGCLKDCLIASGHLGMTAGQNAATKRTILFLLRRGWFNDQLSREIVSKQKTADRSGLPVVFRLNGTSDIDFSDIIAAHPKSKFYDYTKSIARIDNNILSNYDLTFSGSMNSKASRGALSNAIKKGYRIALAFNTKNIAADLLHMPDILGGKKLVSFDDTDLRFLDPKNAIGTLTSKGTNAKYRETINNKNNTFWITKSNISDLSDIIAIAA